MPVARKKRAEPPPGAEGQALIDTWRRLLDPNQTSREQFLATYAVPNKKVRPGERAMSPFILYPYQQALDAIIEEQWDRDEGGKVYGTKGRQEGISTYMLGVAWERFLRGGGGTGNYFSYDDAHSMESFALLLKFKRQTPAFVFECLLGERKPGALDGGGVWTKKSHRQLELTLPDSEGSSLLQCATAGGDYSGSGSAPRWIFLDEFTKYPAKVKDDFTGISEGWYDGPGNLFAIWGTGQGNEQYAKMFTERFGQPVNRGDYVAYFRNWLGHPMRSASFESDRAREQFRVTVGRVKEFGPLEEQALVNAKATLEELNWRRQKLAGPAFRYNLRLFAREYPLVVSDAFMSESGTIFPVEILRTHQAAAEVRERVGVSGDFVEKDDSVIFVPSHSGSWTLYEPASDDLRVCFGADSASGKVKQTGSNKEADWSTADFSEVYTGRTVAEFRAHLEGRGFGEELVKAARYYSHEDKQGEMVFAKGYPEINNESGAAMMAAIDRKCEEMGYQIHDFVMMQSHPVLADGKRPDPSLGWRTTGSSNQSGAVTYGSRGILFDNTKAFIHEVGEWKPGMTTPYTERFLNEAYNFSRNEKGRVEASSGHDDMVFAKMLSVTARDVQLASGEIPLKSKTVAKKIPTEGPMMRYSVADFGDGKRKSDPVLGKQFQW